LSPTGKELLTALVRDTKYGAYDAAGVALSVMGRKIAAGGLTVAEKPRGRRQLDSWRKRAAMSGRIAAMDGASG